MHQPPTVRYPSYTDLYGPGFGVMLACAVLDVVLAVILFVVMVLFGILDTIAWFTGDQAWRAWSEAAASLIDTVTVVCLVSFPVLLSVALALGVSLDLVRPKDLPPWTTREQLRTARALASNTVMSDDPRANYLARVYAGALTRMLVPMAYRPALVISLVSFGFLASSGVYLVVRNIWVDEPATMALGLHSIIFGSGMAVSALVFSPRRQRMRAFCDLYDAAHQGVAR